MIKIADYKKWIICNNSVFYDKFKPYFSSFENKDKRSNRIYFKLDVAESNDTHIPQEILDYMNYYRYPIVDYNKGLCKKEGKEIRIGKLFKQLNREDLLKVYSESKTSIKNTENLYIVISRHPYDIIGMSTNRGWSTCIDLNDKKYNGNFLYSLKNLLSNGCLVAYLIRDNDKNIETPISRILINNSFNKLILDNKCYGTYVKEFKDFLSEWVLTANKNFL